MVFQAQNLFGIFKEKHPCRSQVLVSHPALFSPRVILAKVDSNSVRMWFVTKSLPIVASVLMFRHVYQKILLNLMKAEVLAMQHQFRVGQFPYSVITTCARISTLQNTLPLGKKWAFKYKLQLKSSLPFLDADPDQSYNNNKEQANSCGKQGKP